MRFSADSGRHVDQSPQTRDAIARDLRVLGVCALTFIFGAVVIDKVF